jgi:hypothetical protein
MAGAAAGQDSEPNDFVEKGESRLARICFPPEARAAQEASRAKPGEKIGLLSNSLSAQAA